jgi:hypothetical protein
MQAVDHSNIVALKQEIAALWAFYRRRSAIIIPDRPLGA